MRHESPSRNASRCRAAPRSFVLARRRLSYRSSVGLARPPSLARGQQVG